MMCPRSTSVTTSCSGLIALSVRGFLAHKMSTIHVTKFRITIDVVDGIFGVEPHHAITWTT
jgi:hypothetical protein